MHRVKYEVIHLTKEELDTIVREALGVDDSYQLRIVDTGNTMYGLKQFEITLGNNTREEIIPKSTEI